jgi:hypothetical protein
MVALPILRRFLGKKTLLISSDCSRCRVGIAHHLGNYCPEIALEGV